MMGSKERAFGALCNLSLEALVPASHFYRHLDAELDLGFVRDLVADCSAAGGRPSIDPVVFFKLQLVMFFEGIRSERELVRVAADRLSVRWYVGYDLDEPPSKPASLTLMRRRWPARAAACILGTTTTTPSMAARRGSSLSCW
jgi:hypothetical protein